MASHSSLRASDADREAVAERLHRAAVEGRLEPDELEERLHAALRARTYGDLGRLMGDLPVKPPAWERRGADLLPAVGVAFAVALRIACVLAVVAVVLVVAAAMAAWWMLWAVVWLVVRGRRQAWRGRGRHRGPYQRSAVRSRSHWRSRGPYSAKILS